MTFRVRLSAEALDDLASLHEWIEHEAGAPIADPYKIRIRTRIAKLADFPNRGTPRRDLGPEYRTLSFERRLLIVYCIFADEVEVVGVVSVFRASIPWSN